METKEIILPEGFEVDKVENGKIILKETKNTLPKNWADWVIQNSDVTNEYVIKHSEICKYSFEDPRCESFVGLLPSKEHAEAILALIQLIRLRDTYRQGWKPNWKDDNIKYVILRMGNRFKPNHTTVYPEIFSFQSYEIRDEFFNNFEDLLNKITILFE